MRTLFGNTSCNAQSRFIEEIPEELMEGYQKYEKLNPEYEEANRYGVSHVSYLSQIPQTMSRPIAAASTSSYLDRIGGHKVSAAQVHNDLSVFEKGKFVMHKRFGAGVITNITPENDDLMLEIMFENAGMKRLMAKYAQLEV